MKKHSTGWEVADAKTGEVIVIDDTRKQAYISRDILSTVIGGKFVVRKHII